MKKEHIMKMLGTFGRVFFYVILAFIVEHKSLIGVDWIQAFDAAGIATIAVLINYINPADSRYGAGSDNDLKNT